MNSGSSFSWLDEKFHHYNLFIPDENDYEDENNQQKDPITAVRYQRYATRLYIFLMIITLYIIFFIALINQKTQVVTVSNITSSLFNQLQLEYGETLSCPCSVTTIPYNVFINNTISFDPICLSVFVTKEWTEALYWANSSEFLVMDFRTTASSQFELLGALCQLCQKTVSESQMNLENDQIVSVEVLSENEIQSQINQSVQLVRTSTPVQITLLIHFLQITTRSNSIISALNTNAIIQMIYMWQTYVQQVSFTGYFDENTISIGYQLSTCSFINSTTPSGFYSLPYDQNANNHMYWPIGPYNYAPNASAMVAGFFGGCMPLDALLVSTLDCLYNITCLNLLEDYFPALQQINITWKNPLPSSRQERVLLNDGLKNLLVEEWLTNIDYHKYFTTCSPTFCSYTTTIYIHFSYMISLFLSLYGGLIIILRFVSVSLVNILYKLKHRSRNINLNNVYRMTYLRRFNLWIKQLNMFKLAKKRTLIDIKQQRIVTRVYLILFTSSFLALLLFTSLNEETKTTTITKPSLFDYKHMQDLHSDTLKCPCSNAIVTYSTFISLNPTLHHICSSDFTTDSWLSMLSLLQQSTWHGLDGRHFRLLSALCQLVNQTIDDAVRRFTARYFVTLNVLTEPNFNAELNKTLNQFIRTLTINFDLLIDVVRLFNQVDQPFTIIDQYGASPLITNFTTTYNNEPQLPQLSFRLSNVDDTGMTSSDCICATDPHCQSSVVFSNWQKLSINGVPFTAPYVIPGMIAGCFIIDSLLFSTLECLYSDICLTTLYYSINQSIIDYGTDFGVSRVYVKNLIYDSTSSIFPPNTSLNNILEKMMIEQWNSFTSFERYYNRCASTYCTYTIRAPRKSFIEIIIMLISIISGLTFILRLITPQFVDFIFYLFQLKRNKQQQDNTHLKLFTRFRNMLCRLITYSYAKIVQLNLFPATSFISNIDQTISKRLGQLATRLYMILLSMGIAILLFYTIIQPQILTKTFERPSLSVYNRLLLYHNKTLQCPCSSISSMYREFITVKPVFHEICSSPFVSDEWRMKVASVLVPDLSIYDLKDYRRFLSAHTQFLIGLCNLSIYSVNDSIDQLLSSPFITTHLQSPSTFRTNIDSLVNQSISSAPTAFARLIFSLRSINHGNAMISTYGTNFQYYLLDWYTYPSDYPMLASLAVTRAITYDNGCSCALNASCTTKASFITANSSVIIPLKGFTMGCTPSESFLASTLECFYDLSCINLIQQKLNYLNYTNTTYISSPVLTNLTELTMKTTIIELVSKLFIENWSTTINYSAYFDQCSPTYCSYTYNQQLDSLYTFTFVLGVYGGLSVVLKWICPSIIYLAYILYQNRKKRSNLVQSSLTTEITAIETNSIATSLTNTCNTTVPHFDPSVSHFTVARTRFSTMLLSSSFFGGFVLMFIALGLIGPWIYLSQQEKHSKLTTPLDIITSNRTINTVATTTIISVITMPLCQPTFEPVISYTIGSNTWPRSTVVADFNSDGYLDIAVVNQNVNNISILFGNNNGTFQSQMTLSTGLDSSPTSITIGDFNRDNNLDLAVTNSNANNVGILLGNDNGTFKPQITFSTGSQSRPTSVVVNDFNSDGQLDLAVSNDGMNTVGIFLGNGNGSFGTQMSFSVGDSTYLTDGDFNGDGQLDLAVACCNDDTINILFGNGNGVFSTPKILSTEQYSQPISVSVGDFNSDNRLDIAVANSYSSNVGILLGNGNGTFQEQTKFFSGTASAPNSIAIGDFNNDNALDVVVVYMYISKIGILLGIGNGSFLKPTMLSIGSGTGAHSVTAVDFNRDGRLDLVVADTAAGIVDILLNSNNCDVSL